MNERKTGSPQEFEITDIYVEEPSAAANGTSFSQAKADAELVEEYAGSALDDLIGFANDTFGEKISAMYSDSEDNGPDIDVIMLLIALAMSKLGITLSVGIDWDIYGDIFGWLSELSFVAIPVPMISTSVVSTVIGTALLLVQPFCALRMNWLAAEHQHYVSHVTFLKPFVHFQIFPRRPVMTPMCMTLWIVFVVLFVPLASLSFHLSSGLVFVLFGVPALYLTMVNIFRMKAWEFVNLRFAQIVKVRQYENLCMKEGVLVLFLFVSSYSFVLNYLISYLHRWSDQSTDINVLLVLGFVLYSVLPLAYLIRIIGDPSADRTFRLFREQLVLPFSDSQMYTKVVLLVESMLFSLVVVLSNGNTTQLICGLVITVVFFVYTLVSRPYNGDVENYSDIVSRGCSTITLVLAIVISATNVSASLVSAVMICVSLIGTLWFLYTLDIMEMMFSKFCLLLQLHAQAKSKQYNSQNISRLSGKQVQRITDSPIEFYVLSAAQKINFAVLRKNEFFHGGAINSMADLGITWLDLQQAGYNVSSMRAFGFTDDELIRVDAQLDDMGDRTDIKRLFVDVFSHRKELFGESHRDTLQSMHVLGTFYRDMGEHVIAMSTLKDCFALRSSAFGADDVDTLSSQLYIGEYCTFLGNPSEGVLYLEQCFEARMRTLGHRHRDTIDTMRALARNKRELNLSKESVALLKRMLSAVTANAVEGNLRSDHPCTLEARIEYADALLDAGRIAAVDELHLKSVMNRQKTLYGVESRTTLALMDRLSEIYSKQGLVYEALYLNLESVSEKTATLGPHHSSTVGSTFQLANSYVELGRLKALENLKLEEIISVLEHNLSPTHPTTISSMVKLGGLYSVLGRYPEAIAVMQTCYERRCATLGATHELTLGVANNIAVQWDHMGKRQEALQLYQSTLTLTVEKLGETHLNSLGMTLNMASAIQNLGDLETALKLYTKVYNTGCEHYTKTHPMTLNASNAISSIHMLKNEWQQASDLLEENLKVMLQIQEETHPHCLGALDSLATCKKYLGKMDESLSYHEKNCELRVANHGRLHVDTIRAFASKAVLLAEIERGDEAMNIIDKCIRDGSASLGPTHPTVVEFLSIKAHVYVNLNDYQRGLEWMEKTLEMYRTELKLGEDHFKVKGTIQKRDWIKARLEALEQQAKFDSKRVSIIEAFKVKFAEGNSLMQNSKLPEAAAVYQEILSDRNVLGLVDTPEGVYHQLRAQLMQLKLNYCTILINVDGQELLAIDILEKLVMEMVASGTPLEAVNTVRKILRDGCLKYGRYEKALDSCTEEYEYYKARNQELSGPCIMAINNRAMIYCTFLKDFVRGADDHHAVLRLLAEFQGREHPQTIQSVEATVKLFADNGIEFNPFP